MNIMVEYLYVDILSKKNLEHTLARKPMYIRGEISRNYCFISMNRPLWITLYIRNNKAK
jgi:hypothetical protein